MVFNATFNNISVISLRSVLLVKKTEVPGGTHRPVASRWQTLSRNVVNLAHTEIRTHNKYYFLYLLAMVQEPILYIALTKK